MQDGAGSPDAVPIVLWGYLGLGSKSNDGAVSPDPTRTPTRVVAEHSRLRNKSATRDHGEACADSSSTRASAQAKICSFSAYTPGKRPPKCTNDPEQFNRSCRVPLCVAANPPSLIPPASATVHHLTVPRRLKPFPSWRVLAEITLRHQKLYSGQRRMPMFIRASIVCGANGFDTIDAAANAHDVPGRGTGQGFHIAH